VTPDRTTVAPPAEANRSTPGDRELAPWPVVEAAARGIATGDHFGMQVYASVDGNVVADFAVGSTGSAGPMTSRTVMPWFSATKPVVALVVGRLVDEGALSFDDRVTRWLPDFAAGGKGDVTVRHLLTHSVPFAQDLSMRYAFGPFDAATAAVCRLPLRNGARVGRTACYTSVAAWHTLAVIIDATTGVPVGQAVRDRVFRPLDMDDCWLGVPPEQIPAVLARATEFFEVGDDGLVTLSGVNHEDFLGATIAGIGGVGPMRELAKVYEALVAGRTEAIEVSAETARLMVTSARRGLKDSYYGGRITWGLGFITDRRFLTGPRCGTQVFGHDAHRCALTLADPDHRLVFCGCANGLADLGANHQRFRRVLEAVLDEADVPPLGRVFKGRHDETG
jgi:CubicO group peptidase (beta-lactamase class C family)